MVSVGDWDVQSRFASRVVVSRKQMGSSTFDDTGLANCAGLVASQNIEINRGNNGRVSVSDPA
jgi:hypothetical protein